MTVKQVFEQWKKNLSNEYSCVHGGLAGGPGFLDFGECSHPNHPDVRYGCKHCPEYCPDFELECDATLYSRFLALYHSHPSYYNEKYSIDTTDKDYEKGRWA